MSADRSPSTATGRPGVQHTTVVSGAAANTEITLTGIRPGRDRITAAVLFPKAAEPLPSDLTAGATIAKADKIKFTADTTNGKVLVFWTHVR